MRKLGPLVVVLILCLAPGASADEPQDISNAIARDMVSPYCPGITLHDCPSSNSQELRAQITDWAEDGMSEEAIRQQLEEDFGEDIWATPSTSGSGLWAWVLPIAAGLFGIALVAFLATKWSRRSGSDGGDGPPTTPAQRSRLDRELAALRDRQG